MYPSQSLHTVMQVGMNKIPPSGITEITENDFIAQPANTCWSCWFCCIGILLGTTGTVKFTAGFYQDVNGGAVGPTGNQKETLWKTATGCLQDCAAVLCKNSYLMVITY